jgi:hypothetical protein
MAMIELFCDAGEMKTIKVGNPGMIDTLYRVVFEGDLLPGQQQANVQRKLANLFGVDAKIAGKLFSGKQHKVKSNLDIKQAKKYARAFAKLGALAYIEQEVVELTEPLKSEDGTFTETGSFDVSAVRAFFDKQDAQKVENDKSARHEIFSLDEFDEQAAAMQSDDNEPSGVQNVLSADEIARMLRG